MAGGRPKGAKQKLPSRAWLHDQLVSRNFNALDEFVSLYREAPLDIRARLLPMIFEYLHPKARPEDGDGQPEPPPLLVFTTEERIAMIEQAKGKKSGGL